MVDNKLTKAPTLSSLAPNGIDGRLWVKTLKEQLMSSKDGEPTDAELVYFATVAKSTGLDPAKREIYAIFRNTKQKDGTWKSKMSIQTSIDGFRKVAEESGKYAGSKEPEFDYDSDIKISVNDRGTQKVVPRQARVSVIKIMGNKPYETTRTANWADYYPGEQQGGMWRKLPETMLAKVAEAQALRAAFPNSTSGLYLEEELQQAGQDVDTGVDYEAIKTRVQNAKTYDDLMDILGDYSPEVQKQITKLVENKAKELQ